MMNSNNYRTGVVLAAGLGSRLVNGKNGYKNKPLVPVKGVSLLLRTLGSLELACNRVVIVLGFGADTIRLYVERWYTGSMELVFVVNKKYKLANGLSVLAARNYLNDDFILTMADHIMDDGLMELAHRYTLVSGGAALLVDYKTEATLDMGDATKVLEIKGKIVSIGKGLTEYNCIDTGLFICSTALLEALDEVYQVQGDVSLSEGIQKLSEKGLMYTVDILDGFWQDVDTEEMLEHAQKYLIQRSVLSSSS